MQKRRKRKIIWLAEWDIKEQEAWFSDMASQGWKLIKLGAVFATFEESTPQEVAYRGDVFNLDGLDHYRIKLYRQAGWEFVDSRRHVQIFKENKSGEASEVYTTPAERAETLELLQKKIWNRGLLAIVLSTVLILFNYNLLRSDPVGNYLRDGFLVPLYTIIMYIFIATHMFTGMAHMRKLVKRLKLKEVEDGYIDYRWKAAKKKLISLCGVIVIGSSVVFAVLSIAKSNDRDWYIEIPAGDLPVVRMSEIMTEVEYEQMIIPDAYGSYDNSFTVRSSMLVPEQYELHQTVFTDVNEADRQSIVSYLYEGRNEWIAQQLAQALREEYAGPRVNYELISHDTFDLLWLGRNRSNLAIIAKKDNKVYRFRYNGKNLTDEKVERILLRIEEKF